MQSAELDVRPDFLETQQTLLFLHVPKMTKKSQEYIFLYMMAPFHGLSKNTVIDKINATSKSLNVTKFE